MSEIHPVTDFVSDSSAQVVWGQCSTRRGESVVDDSIEVKVIRSSRNTTWIVGITQRSSTEVLKEVDVQGSVITLAESTLVSKLRITN